MTVDELVADRGKDYGDFGVNVEAVAAVMKALQTVHICKTGKQMNLIDHCNLQYQVVKLVRLAATPNHIDSWKDVQGYAKLSEDYYHD